MVRLVRLHREPARARHALAARRRAESKVTTMSATWLIVVFGVVFVSIAVAIVKLRLNPAISLLLGTIALGLAAGIAPQDLIESITFGFGDLMASVGLLISLGVMMGFLMSGYGAVHRIVDGVLRLFGKRGSPYAFGIALSSVTPSIYFDVLLVLVAPIARNTARITGRPVATTAGPVAMGLAAGNALVVPGAALLAYVGTMGTSVQSVLLPGFAIAVPAVAVTTWLYLTLIERFDWWNTAKDENLSELAAAGDSAPDMKLPSMFTAVAPVLVVLLLIVGAIISEPLGMQNQVIDFLGSPVIALLIGTLTALGITTAKRGLAQQEKQISRALETVGTILVVTAVAGSLGEVIAGTGIRDVLSGLFSAGSALPLLVVWVVAALLRMAMGGQTVAGITAISIIAPLVGDLGVSPVMVVLAAGAGGIFGGQFSDNAFWMLRSLFGLSTRGALKTYTLAQSMLSVVVLLLVLRVNLFV